MTAIKTTGDEKCDESKSALQGLQKNTLKAAGFSFLVADLSLLAYGWITRSDEMGAAAIFGLTEGFVGARYGNPKVEKQLKQVERHLGEYLREQGVEIPSNPSMESLTKKGGVIDHVEDFLYKYPTQIMNICYAMIGLSFGNDGRKKYKAGKPDAVSMMVSGALLISGALGGLLIKEKKFDKDHPPHGLVERIQKNPLYFTGTMLNLNTASQAVAAYLDHKKNPSDKMYMLRYFYVAAFALGNTLLGFSSTKEGGGSKLDEEAKKSLAETSARIIAAQPPEVQKNLLEHISGYLASQPYVHMKADEISAMLSAKLAEVKHAMPAPATGWQAQVTAEKLSSAQPSL